MPQHWNARIEGDNLVTKRTQANQRGTRQGTDSWAEAYGATGDLDVEIARLESRHGEPIIAHGGTRLARSLVASGVVGEYALLVHPVAFGLRVWRCSPGCMRQESSSF